MGRLTTIRELYGYIRISRETMVRDDIDVGSCETL